MGMPEGAHRRTDGSRLTHWHNQWLQPLGEWLHQHKVSAAALNAWSLVLFIPFAYLTLSLGDPLSLAISTSFLLMHSLCSAVAGASCSPDVLLDRHAKLARICIDTIVLIAVVSTLSLAQVASGTIGGCYLSVYSMSVFISGMTCGVVSINMNSRHVLYVSVFTLASIAAISPGIQPRLGFDTVLATLSLYCGWKCIYGLSHARATTNT